MADRVLVVDDDPGVVASLREALGTHQVVVVGAAGVEAAEALLDEGDFCGLILDLALAQGSGYDVLRHMESKKIALPTVVVTQKLPSYVRELLDEEQVKLVFTKPIEPRLVAAIVLGLCGIES